MVAKIAKEVGKEVYKPRPQVVNNDKERSEVGDTESGNAGNDPISNIYLNTNNNNTPDLQNFADAADTSV